MNIQSNHDVCACVCAKWKLILYLFASELAVINPICKVIFAMCVHDGLFLLVWLLSIVFFYHFQK